MITQVHYTDLMEYVYRRANMYTGQGRWSVDFRVVFKQGNMLYGFEYQQPATEMQMPDDEDCFPEIDYKTGMVTVHQVEYETRSARVAVDDNGGVWDVNVL